MTSHKKDDDQQNPAALQEEIESLTNQLRRSQADFLNFKRRVEDEQASFIHFSHAGVLLKILPVLDTLERAVQHVPADLKGNEWVRGVLGSVKQFQDTLTTMGVTPIPAVGEMYNPEFHEALSVVPGEKDVVINELQRGYLLRDKVLRPAQVQVGNG